jgi:hypothetical protein
MLKEFDNFAEAFAYGVDYLGLKHASIYEKIGMDKGQFSNIYTGVVKNPQSSTRKKLTEYVDFEINKNGESWHLSLPNSQVKNQVAEPAVEYRTLTMEAKRELLDRVTDDLKEVVSDYKAIRKTRMLEDATRELTFDGIVKRLQDIIKELD